MNKFEKYSSYKDSGVEWLGEIPYNWEIKELKYALKFTTGGTPSSGVENYYNGEEPWVTIADMTGRYIEKSHFISKKAVRECNMQIVPKNSLLYSFKLSVGQVAFTKEEIYTNEAIASFYPSKNIDLNFWYYVLPIFLIKNANTNIYGAFLLNQDLIKNALIIFPPKDEQTKIASFLDEKTAQIDEVISQKEKLIELLKERKQIVINDAVTKGLDKDVEMTDSGIEWIGKIPKHWEVIKFKHLFYEKKKTHDISLNCGSISFGKVIEKNDEKIPASTKASYQVLNKGEFLINPLNLNYDLKSLRIGLSDLDVVVSSGYIIIKNKENIDKIYFNWLLHRYDIAFMKTLGAGVRQTLNFGDIAETLLVNPPIDEQIQIAEYIENQTTKIDKAIELQQNYISKLKEYKASLIDSVVTGKVRVA